MKKDLKSEIAEMVISAIEKDNVLPWDSNILIKRLSPRNSFTQKEYKGINKLILGMLGGSSSNEFATFNQVNKNEGKVIEKGGLPVIFYSPYDKKLKTTDISKSNKEDIVWFWKKFIVFPIEKTTLEPKIKATLEEKNNVRIEEAETFIAKALQALNVKLVFEITPNGFFSPTKNSITMPELKYFKSSEEYYSTLFHELVHAYREVKEQTTKSYSKEEVFAEMGSMFICNHFGILKTTKDNSIAYVKSWIEKLRKNPEYIVDGANGAEKMLNSLLGNENKEFDVEEEQNKKIS